MKTSWFIIHYNKSREINLSVWMDELLRMGCVTYDLSRIYIYT